MNTLVYGFNHVGKTERIIIPEIQKKIDDNESFFFLDTNVEYYPHFKQQLLDKGYTINVINFQKIDQSICWNPLSLPYSFYKTDKQLCIELLKNIGHNIFSDFKEEEKIQKYEDVFVGLSLILFSYARIDAINLFSLNNLFKHESMFGLTLTTFDKQSDEFHYLAQILALSGEDIFDQFQQQMRKYLLYENLSNLLSYNDYDLENIANDKVALFIINKKDNKYINNLVNVFIHQISKVSQLNNKKINFVFDNIEKIDHINDLNNIIKATEYFDSYLAINELELYKKNYSMDNLDVIYHLEDDGSVIKAEKTCKRKHKYEDYPKTKIHKTAEYPVLQEHPKFLFNLTNYIKRMKGI